MLGLGLNDVKGSRSGVLCLGFVGVQGLGCLLVD